MTSTTTHSFPPPAYEMPFVLPTTPVQPGLPSPPASAIAERLQARTGVYCRECAATCYRRPLSRVERPLVPHECLKLFQGHFAVLVGVYCIEYPLVDGHHLVKGKRAVAIRVHDS